MDATQIQFTAENHQQVYFFQSSELRIEVLQNQHHIWMDINGVVQSAFESVPPYRPALPHTLVMFLPQIHDAIPNSILELGGGGQSAQRYLALSQPQISFTSVENNADVINTVQQYLPGSEKLNIIQKDAFEYIANDQQQYDWLMVDLFYGSVEPQEVFDTVFFKQCKARINDGGWFIFNILNNQPDILSGLVETAQKVFGSAVKLFAVPGMQNHILMVKNGADFVFPTDIERHNLAN